MITSQAAESTAFGAINTLWELLIAFAAIKNLGTDRSTQIVGERILGTALSKFICVCTEAKHGKARA